MARRAAHAGQSLVHRENDLAGVKTRRGLAAALQVQIFHRRAWRDRVKGLDQLASNGITHIAIVTEAGGSRTPAIAAEPAK